jgi:hypothetical protein
MVSILVFALALMYDQKVMLVISGLFVALFLWHSSSNLIYASKHNVGYVSKLLNSAIAENDPDNVLNDPSDPDYSEFEAFSGVPIINNKQLNKIRLRCHYLINDDEYFNHRDDDNYTLFVTDKGKQELTKLINEIKDNYEKSAI